MQATTERRILTDLEEEKKEIETIEYQVAMIRERLLDRVPEHFSRRDIMNAVFGALTLGITFILKGAMVSTAVGLATVHMELITFVTFLVLFGEIYFIGYSRVKNKSQRRFGQFMTKRLFTLYFISVAMSFALVYLLNINHSPYVHSFQDVMRVVVLMAFPCAIGAAVPSLLKKY
jgi:uncharacterized membrane protein